jgi:hypothetical protein
MMTKPRVFGSILWIVPRLKFWKREPMYRSCCAAAGSGKAARPGAASAAPPSNFSVARRLVLNMSIPLSLHNLIFDTQPVGLLRNRLRKRRYHG